MEQHSKSTKYFGTDKADKLSLFSLDGVGCIEMQFFIHKCLNVST